MKLKKAESTNVNEHFFNEYNAVGGHYGQTQNNKNIINE